MYQPVMTIEQIDAFLSEHFPQADGFGTIEKLHEETLRLRLNVTERHLRPGGTVSGPVMMTLADTAMYYLLLSRLGPVALAVTTSLNINFLRRPDTKRIWADARLLKLGKRLAVGEAHIFSSQPHGEPSLVAQASLTYSIPPR